MNEDENIRTIQTLFENLNARNLDASDALIAEDYQALAPGWPSPYSRDKVKSVFEAQFQAFPDLRYELQDVIAQGNKAVAIWEATGTHTNAYVPETGNPIPATNRTIRNKVATYYEFRDGLVVRQQSYLDQVDLFSQLGLMQAAPGTE